MAVFIGRVNKIIAKFGALPAVQDDKKGLTCCANVSAWK